VPDVREGAGDAGDVRAGEGVTEPPADLPADLVHDLALDLWDRLPRDEVECDRCRTEAEPYHGRTCWRCWAQRVAFNAYRG